MSTRVGHSIQSPFDRLSSASFIPVKAEKGVYLAKPFEVYFVPQDGSESPFKTSFTFIDFGERGNLFLRYCGVKSEPSVKGELSSIQAPKLMTGQTSLGCWCAIHSGCSTKLDPRTSKLTG